MEIRRIQVSDVPSFLDLWSRTYSEGFFLAKSPPPEDRVRSAIELVASKMIPNFVAIEGRKVIGAVEVFPGTMCGKKYEGAEKVGHLGIQVDSAYRRMGIGNSLMMAAISDAIRFGFDSIELSVFETNFAAIRLYEKVGFVKCGQDQSDVLLAGSGAKEQQMVFNIVHNKRRQIDAQAPT